MSIKKNIGNKFSKKPFIQDFFFSGSNLASRLKSECLAPSIGSCVTDESRLQNSSFQPALLKFGIAPRSRHSLLEQIGEGLLEDDATNFEKLTIARKYGPLLLELKTLVPHGRFKPVLKERFPRVSYSKCNRWMVIARHESEVTEALVAYPDVAWGPKKMIDYLTKEWRPEIDSDEDEEECWGCVSEESAIAPEATVVPSETVAEDGKFSEEVRDDADDRSRWEQVAANAESAARMIGTEPVVQPSKGILSVTVFSDADLEVIHDSLSRWQPKSSSIFGRKGASNITATVTAEEISDVLFQLAETLKKSLPTQLKLSIDL